VLDDFESEFHFRSSPIFSEKEDGFQNTTSCATYDTFSLTSESNTSQSDFIESDQGYETDTEAQHVLIYPGHPLYKHSSSSDLSSSDEPDTFSDFGNEEPPAAIGDVVLDDFVQELRRMIPGGDDFEFDATFLEEMDSRLLLKPMDVFDDLCWAEISRSLYPRCHPGSILDSPFDLADEDVEVEDWYKVCSLITEIFAYADSDVCPLTECSAACCSSSEIFVPSDCKFAKICVFGRSAVFHGKI
jgi:hypothetical protein